jgi:hypothetical protein
MRHATPHAPCAIEAPCGPMPIAHAHAPCRSCSPMPALTPCDPMHRGFPPGRAGAPGVCYRACIGSRQARTFDFEIAQGAYCLLLIACCLLRRRRHTRKGLQKSKAEGVVSSSTCCVYSVQAQRTAYRCWFIGCWMLATCRCRGSRFERFKKPKETQRTCGLQPAELRYGCGQKRLCGGADVYVYRTRAAAIKKKRHRASLGPRR